MAKTYFEHVTAEGDLATCRWRVKVTFAVPGRCQGLRPNGARVQAKGVDLVRVSGTVGRRSSPAAQLTSSTKVEHDPAEAFDAGTGRGPGIELAGDRGLIAIGINGDDAAVAKWLRKPGSHWARPRSSSPT
ncbi:hypothetical protein N8J89_16845 [Crossiella sp. CA-258035]|uniref:hypothetical protein n=1 Tax=Crossiella sp. CA-258035 TaxID=2981138 RepID=UPI0024BD48B3|nr:hypothetical protein [Crossiella sp. CA-258035]WHT22666.1 hypothetical protein N8J89_16845 [Crossiella sp. CA-258035]